MKITDLELYRHCSSTTVSVSDVKRDYNKQYVATDASVSGTDKTMI